MKELIKRRRNDEGFTLIELLIVIIILAILAVIVVFVVGTTTKNAAAAACKLTGKSVQTALEAYKAQVNSETYPTTGALTRLWDGYTTLTTGTKIGPWLKSAVPTSATGGHKYWFTYAAPATGSTTYTLNVTTVGDPAAVAFGSTGSACSTA